MTDIIQRPSGDAIKAIDGNRVAGYLVRFTNENDRDLHNEYFDKRTNFWLNEHPVKGRPILIDHAFDEKFKSIPVGIIDFVKEDEIGIWIEGKLKDRKEYEDMLRGWKDRKYLSDSDLPNDAIPTLADNIQKAVKSFFATGKAQWSSGALPQGVEISETGFIKSWPIIEGTAVYTPAEPNGTQINLKSLIESLSIQADTQPTAHKEVYPKDANGSKSDVVDSNKEIEISIENEPNEDNMNEEQLRELIRQEIALALQAMQEQEMPSEAMAAVGDVLEEEVAKDVKVNGEMPEEEVQKAISKSLLKQLPNAVAKVMEERNVRRNQYSEALKGVNNTVAPASNYLGAANTSNKARISVGEERKFAHLSASDMALAMVLHAAPAKSQGIPVRLGEHFSESFVKTFANKAFKHAESEPYGKSAKSFGQLDAALRANNHIKSLMPFKANELNASDITGQGLEWVSEWWSTDLWERERFERHYDAMVQRGMMVQTIPQGADSAHFPTEGSDPVAYAAPQANSVGADGRPETTANFSPYLTGEVTCTPGEIKIATSQTVILEEDSIINVVQNINRQLNEAAMETRDKLLVNGDTSTSTANINYDGALVPTGLSKPYYTVANGFRYHGLTNNGRDASNVLNLEQYRLTLAELDPELRQYYERMVFFIDTTTEIASLAMPEIATDDVRRTNATVTSGRLINIYGVDVRVNGFIPQTDTDGKVTAAGNVANRGTILLVYAPYWGFAYKRQVTLETARNIYSGTNDYVMSMRIGMVARGNNATALTYNVATAVS